MILKYRLNLTRPFILGRVRLITILFFLLISSLSVWAQKLPEPMKPPRLVNDFVNLLMPQEQAELETKLQNYHDTTSTQMYVVIVDDLAGYDIADYAFKLGDKWGIGQSKKNNGLLILIKNKKGNQRGEIFVAVGYGLEGVIPDAYAKRVIYQTIEPAFMDGQFYKGIDESTTTFMQLASGEFKADVADETMPMSAIVMIAIGIAILLIVLSKGSKTGGGGFTGGGSSFPPIGGGFGGGGGSSRGGGFSGGGGGSFGGGGARGGW